MKILWLIVAVFMVGFSHQSLGAVQVYNTRYVFVSPQSSRMIKRIILAPFDRILHANLPATEVALVTANNPLPYVYARPPIHGVNIGLHLTLIGPEARPGQETRPGNYNVHGNLTRDSINNLRTLITFINNRTLSLKVANVMVRGRYLTLSVRIEPGYAMRLWSPTKRQETVDQGRQLLHRFFGDAAHISVVEISNVGPPPFSRQESSENMMYAYGALCQYYLVDAPTAPDYQALYDNIRAELIRQLKPITLRDQFLTADQRRLVEAAPDHKIFLLSWGRYLVLNPEQANLGLPLRMFAGIGAAARWQDTDIIPYLQNLIDNPPPAPIDFQQIRQDILAKIQVIFDGIGRNMPVNQRGIGMGGGPRAGRFDKEFFVNNRLFYPTSLLSEPKIRELAGVLGADARLNDLDITLKPLE